MLREAGSVWSFGSSRTGIGIPMLVRVWAQFMVSGTRISSLDELSALEEIHGRFSLSNADLGFLGPIEKLPVLGGLDRGPVAPHLRKRRLLTSAGPRSSASGDGGDPSRPMEHEWAEGARTSSPQQSLVVSERLHSPAALALAATMSSRSSIAKL